MYVLLLKLSKDTIYYSESISYLILMYHQDIIMKSVKRYWHLSIFLKVKSLRRRMAVAPFAPVSQGGWALTAVMSYVVSFILCLYMYMLIRSNSYISIYIWIFYVQSICFGDHENASCGFLIFQYQNKLYFHTNYFLKYVKYYCLCLLLTLRWSTSYVLCRLFMFCM